MLSESDHTVSSEALQTDGFGASSISPFLVSLLVVILGTAVIDPSRLTLFYIPTSFLLAAHGMGLLLERATQPWISSLPAHLPLLTFTARLGMGISLLGFSTTILGLFGLYRFAGLLIVPATIWSLANLVRSCRPARALRMSLITLVGAVAMGSVWLIAWLWATIPPTFYDELAYHLPLAQYALRTGHIAAFPWSFLTYMPHLSDLLLGWGLALADGIGARSMHFVFWIAIWIAGWAIVEVLTNQERSPWIGYVIAATFASSTTFLFLGTLPFSETLLTFAVMAFIALIALQVPSSPWLPVGFLWGLAISVKLSGLSWAVAGTLAALMLGWTMQSLGRAWLVTLAMALPWWGRAWWLTGNPFYPLGYHWIGSLNWNDTTQARLQGDLPSFPEPFSLVTLLRLPYDMVMAPERFGSAADCGILAVIATCLMLSLPLWTMFWNFDPNRRRQFYAAGLFILVTTTSWIMTSTTTRFFAPALMLGLIVLATLLIKAPKVIFSVSIIILTGLGLWGTSRFVSTHSQVFSSERVALGQEPGAEYAARAVDHYEAATYVREHLSPNAKLLFIGESRPFYFDRPSLAPYPFHEHPLTQWVREAASPTELRDRLRGEGFTHVILNTREFRRLHDKYQVLAFTGPNALLEDQRLKQLPQILTTLFSKHNVYVSEIPAGPKQTFSPHSDPN